ncbi:hypothetical protein PENNAL_c0001G03255 [Penicillium nalgiovense]|uniref:Uncharacterized protein n=1 Tax=Penicillium nalgiovense TaxID=60175 RepID=A0A1V6Z9N1_PENNA|nr:hypothetical protein PENNAL_c0001G03255 [Penicillium nalgiovense]
MEITIRICRSNPQIVLESWKLYNGRVKCQQEVKVHEGENKNVYVRGQPLVLSLAPFSPNGCRMMIRTNNNARLVLLFKIHKNPFRADAPVESPQPMELSHSQPQYSEMPVSLLRPLAIAAEVGVSESNSHLWSSSQSRQRANHVKKAADFQ